MKDDPRQTELFAGEVVDKTDSRIELRGKIDSCVAWAWHVAHETYADKTSSFAELVRHIEKIQIAEAKDDVEELGWTFVHVKAEEARKAAAKAYGTYPQKQWQHLLNILRTKLREAELAACRVPRSEVIDAIQVALNALSARAAALMVEV